MEEGKHTFKDIPQQLNIDELEKSVLSGWEKDGTFEKSLEQNKDKPLFTFYDGPPYATGKPHYGHVLQSSIKDTVLRYKTMRGYYVPRRVGWDTHGLPVEVIVEKELGLRSKKEVLEYGIEAFNAKCREAVFRYIDVFSDTLKRLGRWADYENGYATLDLNYMESEWWVFKQLWDKGLVYKDFRSTPYCIRCATPLSNFETTLGYKDKTDTAIYVRFPVVGSEKISLLVWTTTPWTLPGNAAVAFNPDVEYVSVEHDGVEYVAAKDRVETLFGSEVTPSRVWTNEELQALTYNAPYPSAEDGPSLYSVQPAGFVTAEDGTGFVHIAPAFGTDDFELGKRASLPVIRTVGPAGIFSDNVPVWGGKHIWKANKEIVTNLTERELLFKEEQYTHSYPHCWRCDEPLIYYALDSWFVGVAELKERMLALNENITWIPEHIKHGRFAKGIEMAPDWAVSRNRFWSTPIPVWQCKMCEHRVCVGSIDELKEKSGATEIKDIHRPYVDEYEFSCDKCGGSMKRVEEVLDVWFDAGSMPYAQWHYPFENKELVESGYPADFVVEAIEQTRLWFYVMHVLGVALKDSNAYKNVIGSGIIFGEDGNKLSKKLKNYPEIDPTIEQYGADTLRLFFLSSTLGEPYTFSDKDLQQLFRNFTMTLWNVYGFFVRYAQAVDWNTEMGGKSSHILDEWVLARTKQLEHAVVAATDTYRVDVATREFVSFVDDLSNWYVRRSRERFQPKGKPDMNAFTTLHEVLVRFVTLLSPFMPFITESMYQNLTGKESVHLASIEDAGEVSKEELELLEMMNRAREIVSEGLAARAAAGVKVRQVLSNLQAPGIEGLPEDVRTMIAEEVNVDSVTEGAELKLDTEITPELAERGMVREIIRHGQTLRRKAGYALNEKITLLLSTEDKALSTTLTKYSQDIATALQATAVVSDGEMDGSKDISINNAKIIVGVKKA